MSSPSVCICTYVPNAVPQPFQIWEQAKRTEEGAKGSWTCARQGLGGEVYDWEGPGEGVW